VETEPSRASFNQFRRGCLSNRATLFVLLKVAILADETNLVHYQAHSAALLFSVNAINHSDLLTKLSCHCVVAQPCTVHKSKSLNDKGLQALELV